MTIKVIKEHLTVDITVITTTKAPAWRRLIYSDASPYNGEAWNTQNIATK